MNILQINPHNLFGQPNPRSHLKSSISGVSETLGVIQPEVEFLSSCEPMKPDKSCASKTEWWDRQKMDIPIPKGRNRKERRGVRSQRSPTSGKANFIRFKGWRIILLGFILCSPGPQSGM